MKHALVTGGAGFIGSHLVDSLLADQWAITVIDNFHPFYDPALKEANVRPHAANPRFQLIRGDVTDAASFRDQLTDRYDVIVHLAARAGVRASMQDPLGCQDANVNGTHQMLELARARGITQFVLASSSSVYGINPNVPWHEDDAVLKPISPYASTKVSAELLAHVYSHLYGIRVLALRFFTVYGPRQRPDLAIHKFAQHILDGRPIPVFGDGSTRRDYTYVSDIVTGVRAAMEYERSMYEVINLGNNDTITLAHMIEGLEEALGRKATVERLPEQAGDVPQTWASIEKAAALLDYRPSVRYKEGVGQFVRWLRAHRGSAAVASGEGGAATT
jgi:UDP-glucuronate 4-epimerase